MQTVAVGALVTSITGQARWTGLVAAAAFLPIGVLGPVGGALADRMDRRLLLLGTTIGETILAAVLALLAATGHAGPVVISLTVFAGGCMTAIGFPTYQAMLPKMVPKEDLLSAMSLGAAQYNMGRVIGPAMAGLLIAFAGYKWAFAVNALSFFAVIIALLMLRTRWPKPESIDSGIWSQIVDGARTARRIPGARVPIMTIALVALLVSPFIALIPAVAQVRLGRGAGATSLLVTAQGVGAVMGALSLAGLAERYGRRQILVANLALLCVAVATYGIAPNLWTAAAALIVVGALYIGVLSGLMTAVQLHAPEDARGRIVSLYMLSLGAIYPIGAALQGWLADRVGLPAVTVGAASILLAVLAIIRVTRPADVAALDEPEDNGGQTIGDGARTSSGGAPAALPSGNSTAPEE